MWDLVFFFKYVGHSFLRWGFCNLFKNSDQHCCGNDNNGLILGLCKLNLGNFHFQTCET